MRQPWQAKKNFQAKSKFSSSKQVSSKSFTVNRNCVGRSSILLSVLLKEVKIDILTINQALLLLALTLHGMPKTMLFRLIAFMFHQHLR